MMKDCPTSVSGPSSMAEAILTKMSSIQPHEALGSGMSSLSQQLAAVCSCSPHTNTLLFLYSLIPHIYGMSEVL